MTARSILVLASATVTLPLPVAGQEPIPFRPGMVVTASARIEPGTYRAPGRASLDSALIVVRGDGVTLDLTGVRLVGIPETSDPDRATGVAVRVDAGDGVTIRGGEIRGYRFGILARGTRGLRVLGADLSYGWKPRLFSLVGHESLVDWLSFHQNEEREWMRFGAALYLEDVHGGEIRGNRAVQGMNGLLMVRTDSVRVEDNELAFNSGLGIGLYRASHNEIVGNRIDFDVRGYSHGFYNRGQDSAGILLYEQSSNNLIAYNSVTHGGDGLFLWAGQSTMDDGEGGANDNLILHNDFDWAPTNSVEITFSRNRVLGNRLQGSRYGVWGGYSWETVIAGNCFGGNETGIAIEHGQDNVISGNRFGGDRTAIALWANPTEPSDWGYPQHRDTRSRDTRVVGNRFAGHETVWELRNTGGLDISGNRLETQAEGEGSPDRSCDPFALLAAEGTSPELPADVPRTIPEVPLASADRSAMVVDEWGPYDWRSPKLWPADTTRARVPLRVLGPRGRWTLADRRGVASLSAESGTTGDTLIVVPERAGDWSVELEYAGEATVSPRGLEAPAGSPVRFSFERFEPIPGWDVRFFAWTAPEDDPTADPRAFGRLQARGPLLERREGRLDYEWYRPLIEALPTEHWALEATARVTLPEGVYSIRTISDDAIRVWVGGALVIDHWDPHGSQVDYAALGPGTHDLRVQYAQVGGWSELRVEIVRGSARSTGSAGPH